MKNTSILMLKIAVLLSPAELRERKHEEYLADCRDASFCGVSENQIICGALGASLRARTKAVQQGLAETDLTDRTKHMKMALASVGVAAFLATAGLHVSLPAPSAEANVTYMTNEEMQENVGWTDISTLIISNEPATAVPIRQR